jgi:23S rRNA pseudouridine955/2504/2580 synthase
MNLELPKEQSPSPQVRHVIVDADFAGQRLDNYLLRELKGIPKSRIYRIIRKGEVRINGKRVNANHRLVTGDDLRIPPVRVGDKKTYDNPLKNIEKTIIYENNLILVINKPSGVAVHGGSGVSMGVIESIRAVIPGSERWELIHRLDRDTSGCLMIAKNRQYLRLIQTALRERNQIGKFYRAIVHGQWSKRKTQIEAPIAKNTLRSGERMSKVSDAGKASSTGFRLLYSNGEQSLLEVEAITGRTHQIRVHCRFAGFPVVGDSKYGDEALDKQLKQRLGVHRLLLHADHLVVPDLAEFPGFEVSAPLDDEFEKVQKYIINTNR